MKSITYFDDEQKCWTTFSCDDCEDLRQLKAERDAAVRDLEDAMNISHWPLYSCTLCRRQFHCADKDGELCHPEWRGPQQEET